VTESSPLSSAILKKIEQQIERADHLVALVPPERLEWRPVDASLRVCDLLGHLLESLAGFCAALFALEPDRLASFANLRQLPVNHCCGVEEARLQMRLYLDHIRYGFEKITDADLARRTPTLFSPEGETLIALLLNNLEHLINHKYQLFFYLKLLGLEIKTADLYHISESV
jgi:hypothetical protein